MLPREDTHLQQSNDQSSENSRFQQDQHVDFILQEGSIIEQDQITHSHNNELSSIHNDEVLHTVN